MTARTTFMVCDFCFANGLTEASLTLSMCRGCRVNSAAIEIMTRRYNLLRIDLEAIRDGQRVDIPRALEFAAAHGKPWVSTPNSSTSSSRDPETVHPQVTDRLDAMEQRVDSIDRAMSKLGLLGMRDMVAKLHDAVFGAPTPNTEVGPNDCPRVPEPPPGLLDRVNKITEFLYTAMRRNESMDWFVDAAIENHEQMKEATARPRVRVANLLERIGRRIRWPRNHAPFVPTIDDDLRAGIFK